MTEYSTLFNLIISKQIHYEKLWRGETYFMQVDAHSNFRQGWDRTMVAMIKKTPSFPHSIISNYPPGHRQPFQSPGSYTPSALCGLSFEDAGKDAWTVRLQQSGRSIRNKDDVPRRSCFIAAGFFFTHASFMGRCVTERFCGCFVCVVCRCTSSPSHSAMFFLPSCL